MSNEIDLIRAHLKERAKVVFRRVLASLTEEQRARILRALLPTDQAVRQALALVVEELRKDRPVRSTSTEDRS